MMRTFGVAFGLTAFVSSAMAAELPVKAPPPPPVPVWTWSGVYIGAHIGGGWTNRRFEEEDVDHNNRFFDRFDDRRRASGVVGGGQVGINWQFPETNWLVGLEGDFSGTDIKRDVNRDLFENNRPLFVNMNVEGKIDWLASFRGRIGYASDRWLFYATGGGAFTRVKLDIDMFDDIERRQLMQASFSETRPGWVVGGGIEWAFSSYGGAGYDGGWGLFGGCCWTARVEFLHYDFGRREQEIDFEAPDWWKKNREQIVFRNRDRDFDVNVVRFGLNYKFGPAPAPVAARY
jgi:outer membrane immunogenic protein